MNTLLKLLILAFAISFYGCATEEQKVQSDDTNTTSIDSDEVFSRYSNYSTFFNNSAVSIRKLAISKSVESNHVCSPWENPVIVSSTGNSPNLIRLDDGTLFMAYLDGYFSSDWWAVIRARKSSDNGNTWSSPISVSGQNTSNKYLDPSCIQLKSKRIMCTFANADSRIHITHSDNYGDSWSGLVDVTPGGLLYGDAFVPDLLELNNGEILLGFTDGELWERGGVKVMKSRDGGNTWDAPVWIYDNSSSYDSKIDLLQLSDGTILAGFYTDENGTRDIKLLKSYNNGNTWSDDIYINAGPYAYYWVSLLELKNNEIWAAFNNDNNGLCDISRSIDGGTTWGTGEESFGSGYGCAWPSIIQLPNDTVKAAFATAKIFPENSDIMVMEKHCESIIKTAARDLTVECDGSGNTTELNAWLNSNGGAVASDLSGNVTWTNNFISLSDGPGETGSATVTFTATVEFGNSVTTTATFTINDSTPPEISLDINPEILWPPNHKMVEIYPSIMTSDICCNDITVEIKSIQIKEGDVDNTFDPIYDIDPNSGYIGEDIQIVDDRIFLRAERAGYSDGRVYTITYSATDGSENASTASGTVTVPHDHGEMCSHND